MREFRKMLVPLDRRINNMLGRGTVSLSNAAGNLQILQTEMLAGEDKDGLEHFEPFGFTSNPMPGAELIAAFLDGDRSNGVALVATDRRYRIKNLNPGEIAIFNASGMSVTLSAAGIVINGGGQVVTVNNAAGVAVNNCPVTVIGGDVTADGISLKNHVHPGVTAGGSSTGAPTG